MKKYILIFLALSAIILSCKNKEGNKIMANGTSSIQLPYEAMFTTEFNNNVSDSDLLLVLNSYKYWENGDVKGLRSTMGDSMDVNGADGFKFKGLTDSLMKYWQASRDSLSSVKISMDVWLKNHALKDSSNFINVWYKEIDTYKSGKIDSANYEDDNAVKDGKIVWYSSHKQILK
ncbi:MAG: hypothetical protein ABI172_02870 [Ginsengibacter sp.]|jgi:hypothetical protein